MFELKKKKKKIEWKIKLKMLKKIKIMLAIIHSTIHDFFMVLLVTSISWSSTDNMLEKHTWSLSIGSPQHSQLTTYEYI